MSQFEIAVVKLILNKYSAEEKKTKPGSFAGLFVMLIDEARQIRADD